MQGRLVGRAVERVADLGADAHQVAPRGLHVALAERQPHAGLNLLGQGHRALDDVLELADVAGEVVLLEAGGGGRGPPAGPAGPKAGPASVGGNHSAQSGPNSSAGCWVRSDPLPQAMSVAGQ